MQQHYSYKTLWSIAYPIMLGNLAQTLIAMTDTAFLGRLSSIALGASMVAGVYYYVFSTLAWGFGVGVQSWWHAVWEKNGSRGLVSSLSTDY